MLSETGMHDHRHIEETIKKPCPKQRSILRKPFYQVAEKLLAVKEKQLALQRLAERPSFGNVQRCCQPHTLVEVVERRYLVRLLQLEEQSQRVDEDVKTQREEHTKEVSP